MPTACSLTGLAVDVDSERLYFIDGYAHKLYSCNFDSSDLTIVLSDPSKIRHPFALAMYKVVLYLPPPSISSEV